MRLLAIVEYDGTDFVGFQVQKRGRTVQGEFEQAVLKVTGDRVRIVGSGRTDTGVHAAGQGAHFDTTWNRSVPALQQALNAVLPKDIAIRSLTGVGADFSARYGARSRAYRYTILNQLNRSPLAARYALHVAEPLDAEKMNAAAQLLVGQRDFGAFGTPPRGENTVREMLRSEVRRGGTFVWVDLEANAFLYRMVRRIVGTLILVGKAKMSLAEFADVLGGRVRAGQSVPPHGLCLVAVRYPDFQTESKTS